jgi:hypothetical protein
MEDRGGRCREPTRSCHRAGPSRPRRSAFRGTRQPPDGDRRGRERGTTLGGVSSKVDTWAAIGSAVSRSSRWIRNRPSGFRSGQDGERGVSQRSRPALVVVRAAGLDPSWTGRPHWSSGDVGLGRAVRRRCAARSGQHRGWRPPPWWPTHGREVPSDLGPGTPNLAVHRPRSTSHRHELGGPRSCEPRIQARRGNVNGKGDR